VTRNALLNRRPEEKPFTIARSSFSGTPSALWLGDNISSWEQYIQTIRQMLQFAAVQGIGMVGADSCGFGGNSTETLCATSLVVTDEPGSVLSTLFTETTMSSAISLKSSIDGQSRPKQR
jgi:hypothetical protein